MARMITLLLILCLSFQARTQQLTPVDEGSTVSYKIKNFGFNTTGTFSGLRGTIIYDPANPATMSFDVTVDAATVNSGVDLRDEHLRDETYFDVKNFPVIRFVSVKVIPGAKPGSYTVNGKLTMKGRTQDINIPFAVVPSGSGFLFDGQFKINRRDFGIGGGSTVSDNLEVNLHVNAKK